MKLKCFQDFNCDHCPSAFDNTQALRKHKLRSHRDQMSDIRKRTLRQREESTLLNCEFCGDDFSDLSIKITHESSHLEGLNGYKCPLCDITTTSKYMWQQHFAIHHKDVKDCPVCPFDAVSKEDTKHRKKKLPHHIITVHGNYSDSMVCIICDEKFDRIVKLHRHYNSHVNFEDKNTGEVKIKPYGGKCPVDECPKEFFRKTDLRTHYDDYHLEEACPVDECGTQVTGKTKLRWHIKMEHAAKEENPVMCSMCPKQFKSTSALQVHQSNTHRNTPRETASGRKERFRNTRKFQKKVDKPNEAKVVKEEPPGYCQICGAKFKNAHVVRGHIRMVHKKIRNFSCDRCDKKFHSRWHLEQHSYTHDNAKPFQCVTCGNVYSSLQTAQLHVIKIHNISKAEVSPFVMKLEKPVIPEQKK